MSYDFKNLNLAKNKFTNPSEARRTISKWARDSNNATYQFLGYSEEGRILFAIEIGRGPIKVSLLAGSHSDEPVGPETLRTLLMEWLSNSPTEQLKHLWDQFTFHIIPHINPDGEAINRAWIDQWPDLEAYITHAFREQPGRDLEFGYPNMRVENRLISSYLRTEGPFHLHISLHGMAFSEGLMLLIERHWIDRTQDLRKDFKQIAHDFDLPLHDHDRGGEKGFEYIGPGFNSTPEGRAMQRHFQDKGDPQTAKKFHLSSMEFVRSLGGDPLCLVTELPLFLVSLKQDGKTKEPGKPEAYLALKQKIPVLRKRRQQEKEYHDILEPFRIDPLPLNHALKIQFRTLTAAFQLIKNEYDK